MSRTIAAIYSAAVTLTSATDNPVTIAAPAELSGGLNGSSPVAWTIVNQGLVQGIDLSDGGFVGNSGLISASATGVLIAGRTGTILNTGRILSDATAAYMRSGGAITNSAGGLISGYLGIYGRSAELNVVNAGVIAGSAAGVTGTGIVLLAGGGVVNQSGGSIGGYDGIYGKYDAANVVNAGAIAAAGPFGTGVYLQRGGTVTNLTGGAITGYDAISGAAGAMTLANAGTIAATRFAVRFAAGYADRLAIDPNAVFAGTVDGANAIGAAVASTMELAAGSDAGTLSGIGTQFIDFAQTTIDAGASWVLTGANSFAAGTTLANAGMLSLLGTAFSEAGLVANNGGIRIDASPVTLEALSGAGSVAIGGAGTLEILGSVGAGQTIAFGAAGQLLGIDPTRFAGEVGGFLAGDTIALAGVADGLMPAIVGGNTLEVPRASHPAAEVTLQPGRDYSGDVFAIAPDGAVTAEAPCFLHDTGIRTDRGEVPVQALTAGDRVLTWSGRIRPIVWVGTGRVGLTPGRRTAATPVVVRRNALADGVPGNDPRVTKGHSLFLDGALIPAEFLINHRSILWDDHMREARFYHIELATHDVLFANGAAAESYREDGNRWLFQNAGDVRDRPRVAACAPVLTGGPVVDAAWRKLLDRAGPAARPELTEDADLHLMVDGVRVDAATRSGAALVFNIGAVRSSVRVVSNAAVPQELGLARDPRCLGVALRRIVVRQMARFRIVEMGDRRIGAAGFHPFEASNGLRWTDGDATLPAAVFEGFEGAVELVLITGGSTRYPVFSEAGERRDARGRAAA